MIDTTTALEARANLVWVAEHYHDLRARIRRPEGSALDGVTVTGSKNPPLVIDVDVSDLLGRIDEHTRFLAHVLRDEAGWVSERGDIPGVLLDIARNHYGHWVGDSDLKVAYDFCDEAHEIRREMERTFDKPDPARYVGPCPEPGCDGELYMRNVEGGQCPECMTPWNLPGQYAYLRAEAEDVIMERDVLRAALVSMGYDVPHETIKTWIARRGKIKEVEPGLYRFGDALKLAKKRAERKVSVR